jgi:DNA primase
MIDIAEIKSNCTIEDVFAKLGLSWKSTGAFQCPFHDKHAHNDKNPSCVFWKDHKGIKCFGCGYNANLFDFVKDYLNLDIKETINWFKEHFNLTDIDGENDVAQLANKLNISEEALNLAIKDDYLKFYSKRGIRYWAISEGSPLNVTQERRLDGQMIEFEDGTTAKCRTFGSPSCPIGLKNLKDNIILCEGGTDFLAAYQLILAENLEKCFSPVCILGANNRINEQCLPYFKDKNILVFPDYDKPGINGCHNWETQLKPICKSFYVYDFKDLKTDQGTPVKDLRDFVQINGDDFEEDREVRYPLSYFLELVSNPATSNRLKTSIEQHSLWEEDTITIELPNDIIEEEELSMKAFPVEALPQDMQDYIYELCRIRSVDTTMVTPQVFGTIGGLVGKNVDVCTTEEDEYLRLNTYTFISACTGIGKSRSSQCIQR